MRTLNADIAASPVSPVSPVDTGVTIDPTERPSVPQLKSSARAARRLTKLQRKVLIWWDGVPQETRRGYYLGHEISAAVAVAAVALGPALRSLGWRREQVRLQGQQVGVWVAPGAPSVKRPIGRPSYSQLVQGEQHDDVR